MHMFLCIAIFGSLLLVSTVASSEFGLRPELSSSCLAHKSAVIAGIRVDVASDSKGLGTFATVPIPFGTYIGEYSGECMNLSEVQARFWGKREPDAADRMWTESRRQRGQEITGSYLFELEDGTFVDAEDGELSTWTRFINHADDASAECNVRPFLRTNIGDDPHKYPRFFAIRDIQVGEELLWNYGELFFKKVVKEE
jgi:SET domain-containing protein